MTLKKEHEHNLDFKREGGIEMINLQTVTKYLHLKFNKYYKYCCPAHAHTPQSQVDHSDQKKEI